MKAQPHANAHPAAPSGGASHLTHRLASSPGTRPAPAPGDPLTNRRQFLRTGLVWATLSQLGSHQPTSAATNPPARPTPTEIKVGDLFPSLKDFNLEGKVPPTLIGSVAVVDFWASWCAPCQRTFPVMEDLYLRFRKQDFLIVAINVDKSRVAMEEFLKEHPSTFNVVRDSKRELVSRLRLPSLPATFVLDRTGHVRSICKGFHTLETKREHVRLIEELLKEPAPGHPTTP